jgi:hypothetical protein
MQKSKSKREKSMPCGKKEALIPRSKYTQRGQRIIMITDINSEDRLVQKTFAEHFVKILGREGVYTYDTGTFRRDVTLGIQSFASSTVELADWDTKEEVLYFS